MTDNPDWIIALDNSVPKYVVGNKAANLFLLKSLKFNVPEAFVIPTYDTDRLPQINSQQEYRQAIDDLAVLLPQILPSRHGWAIRSSATIEDLQDQSMAGRFETVYIEESSELPHAVEQVWKSAELEDIGLESMAVIVQRLVKAEYAGVSFSRNPVSGRAETLIEWCRGMGSNLVDGEVTPWRITLDAFVPKTISGLDKKTLLSIGEGVRRLRDALGYDVDVEWAIQEGILYWLQVRPLGSANSEKFIIPRNQKKNLSGVWLRIRHCFAPQVPLVYSMNPGAHFNAKGWRSQLVNQYHYIQLKPEEKFEVDESEFDKLLDDWEMIESHYHSELDKQLAADLTGYDLDSLYKELRSRVEWNRRIFNSYQEFVFNHIKVAEHKAVELLVTETTSIDDNVADIIQKLVSGLKTKTDDKQLRLIELGKIYQKHPKTDLKATAEWGKFLLDFGYESASTHLFYLPTLRETPELFMTIVEHYAGMEVNQTSSNWSQQCSKIEARLKDSRGVDFREHLIRLRRCLRRGENDDYVLQKATAVVRYALLRIGELLKKRGLLSKQEDVFFLLEPELEKLVSGPATDIPKIPTLIALRRQEFRNAKLLSPPTMIINGRPINPKIKENSGMLYGSGASSGMSHGSVVVIRDPFHTMKTKLPEGTIVVVPVVTPAFAYTLSACAGLVTEVGGITSHGAIVARELGIPAVVGIKGACDILKPGMMISIDGARGEIRL